MSDFFADLLRIVTPIFAMSSMASVGLGNSARDIAGPLRSWRILLSVLIASFVVVPLLAWGVSELLSLDEPFATGLMLVACAAGAPFVVMFVSAAGGNLALAAGVLVLQLVVTVAYMPIVLPVALEGDIEVDAVAIATTLAWTMLAPLVIGGIVRAWSKGWADRVRPILGPVSTITLVLLVLSTILANWDGILDIFGEGAILAALLVIAGAFGSGFLLGGPGRETSTVIGLANAQRNIAAAMVVATQNFAGERDVIVMVVVTSLVGMAVLFPAAFILRRGGDEDLGMDETLTRRPTASRSNAGGRAFRPHRAGRKE